MANSGRLMQPTVVREIADSQGKIQTVWFNPRDFSLWMPRLVTDSDGTTHQAWVNLGDSTVSDQPPVGSYQISPFVPNTKWDITSDPRIAIYNCEAGNCLPTGDKKTERPDVVKNVQAGMLAIWHRRATMRCSTPRPSARQLSRKVSTTSASPSWRKIMAPVRP